MDPLGIDFEKIWSLKGCARQARWRLARRAVRCKKFIKLCIYIYIKNISKYFRKYLAYLKIVTWLQAKSNIFGRDPTDEFDELLMSCQIKKIKSNIQRKQFLGVQNLLKLLEIKNDELSYDINGKPILNKFGYPEKEIEKIETVSHMFGEDSEFRIYTSLRDEDE